MRVSIAQSRTGRPYFWLSLGLTMVCVPLLPTIGRADAGRPIASHLPAIERPTVPVAIAVPAGATVSARFHATGAQIYVCGPRPITSAGTSPGPAWTLKAPEAILTDGRGATVGRHAAGPTWTSNDGSSVVGRKLAEAEAPTAGAIPWLLLRATATTGSGVFTGTTYVQRINTAKGKAPSTGCDAAHVGSETRADYAADYYFFRGGDSDGQHLPLGQVAPDFTVVAHDGKPASLSALKGKIVVLYFYPKDDTAGCTKEACEFRDNWTQLQKAGVVVFGVSMQGNESHQAFATKNHLPFPLLPDEKGEIAAKYRVPVVDGRAQRITYLIGKDGRVSRVWTSVNPVGHAAEVLAAVSTL